MYVLTVRQRLGDVSERIAHGAKGTCLLSRSLKSVDQPGYSAPISTYLPLFDSSFDTRVCFTCDWGTSRPESQFQIWIREYVPPACRKTRLGRCAFCDPSWFVFMTMTVRAWSSEMDHMLPDGVR